MRKKLTKRISTVIAAATMALSMQTALNAYAIPSNLSDIISETGEVLSPIGKVTQDNIVYEIFEGNMARVKDGKNASGAVQIPDAIYANGTCYFVKTIDKNAFSKNHSITAVYMQNASNLTSIDFFAFSDCKNLETVALPPKMIINDYFFSIFSDCDSLREFIPTNGDNFNVIDGVLYNKDNTAIIYYPSAKPGESFTLNYGVTALNNSFKNLKYLKNIVTPYEITENNAVDTFRRGANIINGIKGTSFTINGIEPFIYSDDVSVEPQIVSAFKEGIYETFEKFSTDITDEYAKRYAAYVVNSIIDDEDSDFVKAVKLHDWLCDHTEYDPVVSADREATYPNFSSEKDHRYASAFLHYVKADGDLYQHDGFYTVCDGYARAYKLLMNAAGISCERVGGTPVKSGVGHAWNILRLNDKDDDASNDKYYYVDVTWDSSENYKYFMSFGNAGNNNHRDYSWYLETKDAFDSLPTEADVLAKFGDADHNGEISVNDYKKIKEFIATGTYDENADVNVDGQVNNDDADVLAKYMLIKRGDLNSDGVIDQNDINALNLCINYSLKGIIINTDLNYDGEVDYADLEILQTMLGTKSQSIPNLDARFIKDLVYNTYPEFNYGDIDNSGNLNFADSMMIRNIITADAEGNYDFYTEDQHTRADINRDGKVDSEDSAILNDYLNNAISGNTASFCQFMIDRLIEQ